jgi:hypothetical protein
LAAAINVAEDATFSVNSNARNGETDDTFEPMVKNFMTNFSKQMNASIIGSPKNVRIAGFPAKQFEMRGTRDNRTFVIYYTVILTPNTYYRIQVVVPEKNYDQHPQAFQRLVEGIRIKSGDNSQ